MRLPRRRTLWLSVAVLLAVVTCAWFFAPQSRITQANYDRIQYGMTKQEVEAILGHGEPLIQGVLGGSKPGFNWVALFWRDGPTYIRVRFDNDRVAFKDIYPATAWETLKWHAMKGAAKIGIKWLPPRTPPTPRSIFPATK